MSKAGPGFAGRDGERVMSSGTLTCRPHMSGPSQTKAPQNCAATEETQVRAPSQETARQTPVSQPLSVKTAEQQALTPILAGIGVNACCSAVLTDNGWLTGVCRAVSCDGARTCVSSVAAQFCGALV